MDARGATVLYARTRAKLRRRAAWDGDARSLLNVADAKLLEALIRSDETAGRSRRRDGAVARVGRRRARGGRRGARERVGVAARRRRVPPRARGYWLARMAAAARHGADARAPSTADEGPVASGERCGGGWA